ncbi:dinitrogenase iron-molybdenum cofactor biosynthesis protein [Candidatus Poribacteria bacterium]|jgi:predicted Fe-Mo cluster-binding NifX family protein|nr:dinitrogenase iron-molybdenum cofactor biosynthesis protein [Candidatus Poribacteria bacterium]
MKIAAVTDNYKTITEHFGRARHYVVFTVEDGEVVSREIRQKNTAVIYGSDCGAERPPIEPDRSFGAGRGLRLSRTISVITDCDVVLARGLGAGMYRNLQQAGIRPFLTDVADVEEAVSAYIEDRLVEQPDRIHASGA